MIGDIKHKVSNFFSGLKFEEQNHKYTYQGKQLPSVSGLIHRYIEEVDWVAIATRIAKRDGKTVEEVMKPWQDKTIAACDRGHEIHTFAEQPYKIAEKRPEDKMVRLFWEELSDRYVLVGKEVRMVHKKFMYCGTSDVILWDTYTGTLVIVDYKTNEDLFKNFNGRRMLEPFFFLEDCPYNHYQLQLSYYQLLAEQLGIEVSERWLVHFHEKGYKIYKLEDYSKDLQVSFTNNGRNNKRYNN